MYMTPVQALAIFMIYQDLGGRMLFAQQHAPLAYRQYPTDKSRMRSGRRKPNRKKMKKK